MIPELNGKLQGGAFRVPTPTGSVTDFSAILKKETTVEEMNAAFKAAADGPLKGVFEYSEEPLVLRDIVGTRTPAFWTASRQWRKAGFVKVVGWYDNEWGYSTALLMDWSSLFVSLISRTIKFNLAGRLFRVAPFLLSDPTFSLTTTMAKKTVSDLDVKGKRALVRVDFNVPQDGVGEITDDTRIQAALPTINHLVENGAKVVLMSHLGRPKGEKNQEFTLAPIAKRLGELTSAPVNLS